MHFGEIFFQFAQFSTKLPSFWLFFVIFLTYNTHEMHFFQLNLCVFHSKMVVFEWFCCKFSLNCSILVQFECFLLKIGSIWSKINCFCWCYIINFCLFLTKYHQISLKNSVFSSFLVKIERKLLIFAHFWCFFVIFLMYSYTSKITQFRPISTNFGPILLDFTQKWVFFAQNGQFILRFL